MKKLESTNPEPTKKEKLFITIVYVLLILIAIWICFLSPVKAQTPKHLPLNKQLNPIRKGNHNSSNYCISTYRFFLTVVRLQN